MEMQIECDCGWRRNATRPDRPRKTLLAALGIFAVASVLGGLASNPGLLVGARFVKGGPRPRWRELR